MKVSKSNHFLRNCISIFLGGVGSQSIYLLMSNYATLYFTDFLGISAGTAGIVFLLSRIWDAVNDPMCGIIIERSNPRFGKVQTFMFLGGSIAAVSLVLLFTNPGLYGAGNVIWGAFTYNLLGMSYTAVTVSVLLQMARGTDTAAGRINLSISYSLACSLAGIVLSVIVTQLLTVFSAENAERGYQITAIVCALMAMLFIAVSSFLFKDLQSEQLAASGVKESKPKAMDMIKAVFKVPSFLIMLLAPCLVSIGAGVGLSGMLYYLTYCLGKPEYMAYVLPAAYVGTLLGSASAGFFIRFGKNRMVLVSILSVTAASVLRLALGDSTPAVLTVLYGLLALSTGWMQAYLNPCLIDCADYAEYKTGIKCQGLALTGFSLANKMSVGLGSAILGFGMELGGYVGTAKEQTQKAIDMIHFLQFWPTIILSVAGAVLMLFYRLDEKTMENVRMKLTERRTGITE